MSNKVYLPQTVLEAAKERIAWIFDEFEAVAVAYSGGKDSDCTLRIALEVAEEKDRLPLPVMFLDQELEWQSTIDHMREVMSDPRIKPYWLQIPFFLSNAMSIDEEFLHCWDPDRESDWMRPKEPNSIHENITGQTRYYEILNRWSRTYFPGQRFAQIGGVRADESVARFRAVTGSVTYKGETWGRKMPGKVGEPEHYGFYPLYDWTTSDIWKAIHDHGWPYCELYDYMYQYGIQPKDMRVSSLVHETAVATLRHVQEIEGDTWSRATMRLQGVGVIRHMRDSYVCPKELPPAFNSWQEYRDYLLKHLLAEKHQPAMRRKIANIEKNYRPEIQDRLARVVINAILVNDYEGAKIETAVAGMSRMAWNYGKGRRAEAERKKPAPHNQ